MTATAAFSDYPRLGFSNAIGGIAAQTAALGAADLAYRRANLEHAAASLSNMLFAVVLIALLALALLVGHTSGVTIFGIHPGSVLLVGAYWVGLTAARQVQAEPLWVPKRTRETVADEPEDEAAKDRSTGSLWLEFLGIGLLVSAAGWAVAEASQGIVEHTGLDESVVGTVLMGLTNAMPETITSIAAVRRGALTLAVGSVLGGNNFDVLTLVVGDVAYRGGSLYHAAGLDETFVTLVTIFMTTILLGGMIRRERQGPVGIGWESVLLLVTYVAMIILITWGVNGT
jgi:cation:H+ antiporter